MHASSPKDTSTFDYYCSTVFHSIARKPSEQPASSRLGQENRCASLLKGISTMLAERKFPLIGSTCEDAAPTRVDAPNELGIREKLNSCAATRRYGKTVDHEQP
jgi:hypothetical protein